MKLYETKKTKQDLPVFEKMYTWESEAESKLTLLLFGFSILLLGFLVGYFYPTEKNEEIPYLDIDSIIETKSKKYNLDSTLVRAVIAHESRFDMYAHGAANDLGLMQVLDINMTKKELEDPFDPNNNIEAGTRYLNKCFKKYGNTKKAVTCYNMGLNGNYNTKYINSVCEQYYIYMKKYGNGGFGKNCL